MEKHRRSYEGSGLKPELARLKEDVRLQSTAKEVCSLLFDSACPFVCFFLSSLRGKGGVVMNGMRRESLLLLCRSPLRHFLEKGLALSSQALGLRLCWLAGVTGSTGVQRTSSLRRQVRGLLALCCARDTP